MNGYHMIEEIHGQAAALTTILEDVRPKIREVARDVWNSKRPETFYLIGCGSSYYAAMLASFYKEYRFGLDSHALPSSEFVWFAPRLKAPSPILIALSRSGMTSETVEATRKAKKAGVLAIAITADPDSTMGRECDDSVGLGISSEQSMIMTKTFTGSALCSVLLGLEFAKLRGNTIPEQVENELIALPDYAKQTVDSVESQVRSIAETSGRATRFIYLGSGANYPVCLEGALKLRETSYSASEAYHAMEFRHGPFSELEAGIQVFGIVPRSRTTPQEVRLLKEVASTGAKVVPISNVPDLLSSHSESIRMPDTAYSDFAAFSYMIPMQMLAYYHAVKKALNPDRPRNLARYVATEIAP